MTWYKFGKNSSNAVQDIVLTMFGTNAGMDGPTERKY